MLNHHTYHNNSYNFVQEEPGGQRALIFDQGNRISQVNTDYTPHCISVPDFLLLLDSIIYYLTQGISCADVADICVKALHDSSARNKSFDVGIIVFVFPFHFIIASGRTNASLLQQVCYEYMAEQGNELYELVSQQNYKH